MNACSDYIKDLKVAVFVPETYPSYAGGGRSAFNFCSHLVSKGARPIIVCLNYNKQLEPTDVKDGVYIRRIPYFNKSLLTKILSIPGLVINYFQKIRQYEVVMIYGYYLPLTWLIIFFAKILGKKVVFRSTMLGEDDFKTISEKTFGLLHISALKSIQLYFAINDQFEKIANPFLNNSTKIFTSYQGIDGSRFYFKPKEQFNSKTTNLLIIGKLINRKGYEKLFYALSKFDHTFDLNILGQFKDNKYHHSSPKELAEMACLYKMGSDLLHEKVKFAGVVEQIEDYMHKADILLYTGLKDGTPNVVLEAMACGLPVIMYNNLPDNVLFKPGKTLEVFNDFEELPYKINYLVNHPDHANKIARNAASVITKNYTFEKVAQRLFDQLYCKIKKEY